MSMKRDCSVCGMILAAAAMLLLAGCSNEGKIASESKRSGGLWGMKLISSAFKDGGEIPAKYTADGQNISPPLKWNAGPSDTKEYAIIIEDVDAGGDMPAVHWLVFGIPAGVTSLPEGGGTQYKQGRNFKGQNAYTGPESDSGKKHRYYFQIFALSEPLDAKAGATRQELGDEEGWVYSKGRLIGTYGGD